MKFLLLALLLVGCNGGPKLKHGERVVIVKGFYEGQYSDIYDYRCISLATHCRYKLYIDKFVWILEDHLKRVE